MKTLKLKVYPGRLEGKVVTPPGKSLMQRAIIAGLLAGGKNQIDNPCFADDALAMLEIARQLGYTVEKTPSGISLNGTLQEPYGALNVGESGLGARLIMPIAALYPSKIKIDGMGSLLKRPMNEGLNALKQLGVSIEGSEYLPITLKGPLQGGKIEISGALSSQFLSGLLMALPKSREDSEILVSNLQSKPYVDLTLEVMQHFGVKAENENYQLFKIKGKQFYKPNPIVIEGDWSSGAALMIAGAVAGSGLFEVQNCGGNFTHADSAITGALLFAGVKITRNENNYIIRKGSIRGFNFDATDSPDLFPVLASLAAFADKPSTIKGVHRLVHKESNRASVLQNEFAKCGIEIILENDNMIIKPGKPRSADCDSHGDHRIAMALAILALGGAVIQIDNAECVSKSYPDFWLHLQDLGALIEI